MMRVGLACAALVACTSPEPPPQPVDPEPAPLSLPAAGSTDGVLTVQSRFAGAEESDSMEAPLAVVLDHRAEGREVLSVTAGEAAFSLEFESDRLFIVRGGWRVEASPGNQTATRGDESAEVVVETSNESGCERIAISRHWGAVSALHATSESLSFVLCGSGEIVEVAADTTFPSGNRSLLWSSSG